MRTQKASVLPCHHPAGAPQDLLTALGRHLAAWNKVLAASCAEIFGQAIQFDFVSPCQFESSS